MFRSSLRSSVLASLLLAAGGAAAGTAPSVDLKTQVGRGVVVTGRLAEMPWQHVQHEVTGKRAYNLDLDSGQQVVVHSAGALRCAGDLRVEGKVIAVAAPGRRQGRPGKGAEPLVVEHQIDVERADCADDAAGLEPLIDRLGDGRLGAGQKRDAEERILAAGKTAIRVLIAHLGDRRPYATEQRPLDTASATPPDAGALRYADVTATVGERCAELLHRMILPAVYRQPLAGQPLPAAHLMYRVEDWPAWWESHAGLTLEQMRDEIRPVVDRFVAEQRLQSVR